MDNTGKIIMQQPSVGIFFVVERQFLIDAVPLEQASLYGDNQVHGGHYKFWEQFTPKTPPEQQFKARAYDAYPRGRIVYMTNKRQFFCYVDACLRKKKVLKQIAQTFGLNEMLLAHDEHYQCATCNPLFLD